MSSEKEKEDIALGEVVKQCVMQKKMIDITAKQLIGLRTQCTTTEELTQKMICDTESKLIKLFGKQLVAKSKLQLSEPSESLHQYPNMEQWLHVVGFPEEVAKSISEREVTVEQLMEVSDDELRRLMERYQADSQDVSKLIIAFKNLKMWTEQQLSGVTMSTDQELHWSSYKSASSSPYSGSPKFTHHQRPSTTSLPADTHLNANSPTPTDTPPLSTPTSPVPLPSPAELRKRFTPPPTPPLVKPSSKGKFPTTPPPHRRNKLYPNVFPPLTKSKSHESQLSMKVNQDQQMDMSRYMTKKPENLTLAGSHEAINQRKRSTDGHEGVYSNSRGPSGQTSPLLSSPRRSPPYKSHIDTNSLSDDVHPLKKNQLSVPISPRGGNMKHAIAHRLSNTYKLSPCDLRHRQMFLSYKCKQCKFQTKVIISTCDLCNKHVFRGKVCRECKARYHKECAIKAAPACGLPQELLALYLESLSTGDGSPNVMRRLSQNSALSDQHMVHANSVPVFAGPDSASSATSSCTSSTPSSPALFMSTHHPSPPCTPHPSPHITITSHSHSQFLFPDIQSEPSSLTSTLDSIGTVSSITLVGIENSNFKEDVINTNTSNDSDKSDKTLVDASYGTEKQSLLDRVDSQEIEDGLYQNWTRVNSISVTLKEWDIPYEDLDIGDEIGTGRFGTVHKGKWHGEIAIKMLKTDPDRDNQAQLQAFKLEVAMLRKTRHENLVLFMGACMKPPRLAIVTSLCRGKTLFTHVHLRKEKFTINRAIIIAIQIAQGMSYLHAKGIIHRDLKSKNIFLEGGKAIITDFGLFSVTKLCHGNRKGEWLIIPTGWLCYLAPEIMRALHVGSQVDKDLPFSEASDIFAFGTVWFELLAGDWPFRNQAPEVTIWQVGKGIKQSLNSLQASRDVKDILMMCWAYKPHDRPDFAMLHKAIDHLPKKRLARSPSHPIQLSRSAESVF